MPIFDFSCNACHNQFEALVRGDKKPACPACESKDLERLPSLPAVQSSGTRELALRAAKKRDAAQANDRMHERLQYERSHDRHG